MAKSTACRPAQFAEAADGILPTSAVNVPHKSKYMSCMGLIMICGARKEACIVVLTSYSKLHRISPAMRPKFCRAYMLHCHVNTSYPYFRTPLRDLLWSEHIVRVSHCTMNDHYCRYRSNTHSFLVLFSPAVITRCAYDEASNSLRRR